MTKRFVDYFDKDYNYIIQDLQNEDEYQVGFVNCDEDVFLKLVNRIAEENEQLKQRIKVLEDSVDGLAGTIAHFDLDEVMWND